ncbi:MAG: 3-methyl-2-oxobutanoate hydroxymethyltransferase [Candidatus Latescibacteria bacterium]|nr:3-methyl-2-oxobutanoate hydroxymethyltransferase [Candidatus Latescibacterota bacterium]
MPDQKKISKVTIPHLLAKKRQGHKITMLTAYDFPTAQLEDQAGIDIVFVGDSVGINILGYRTPQEVTMDDMLHHTRAVRRGVQRAFLLADMPFLSYQPSVEMALINAGRLVQEAGAEGVKLEGGHAVKTQVERIVKAGIPVMGHLGFTPQSRAHEQYLHSDRRGTVVKVQGKGPLGAKALIDEARLLEDAGVFGLVLEEVTEEAAQSVAERLAIPVIGIGAGRFCDGQVLIFNDLVGLSSLDLRLAKSYATLRGDLLEIFQTYRQEVEQGLFPSAENALHMEPAKLRKLQELLK